VGTFKTIEDALNFICQQHEISNYCKHCGVLTHSRRKTTIWRLPNTLVIHFKKIGFDTLGKQVEIKEAVKFPIKGFSLDEYYDEHSRGKEFENDLIFRY